MVMTARIVEGYLRERHVVRRMGKGLGRRELQAPSILVAGEAIEPGIVYVGSSQSLPTPIPAETLFVCMGDEPKPTWEAPASEVLWVRNADTVKVFNEVQSLFRRVGAWELAMERLLSSRAGVVELIRQTIPLFGNRISVTDRNLRSLGSLGPQDDKTMDGRGYLPIEISLTFAHRARKDQRTSTPFWYEEQDGTRDYVINLYLGNSYVGSCSLQEKDHPVRDYEQELFQAFSRYVLSTLKNQAEETGEDLVSMRSVFERLLRNQAVSKLEADQAHDLALLDLGKKDRRGFKWCCSVIDSANHGRELPEQYLCRSIEELIPHSDAFMYEGKIVVFSLIPLESHRVEEIGSRLQPLLSDMNFRAGMSRSFTDVFRTRRCYLQALCALDTGRQRDADRLVYPFGDYVLDYMLENCLGDLDVETVMTPGLLRLRDSVGTDLLETLRVYLDYSCNASLASRKLYLHRSTFSKRIERIEQVVDISTPERRLLVQILLHLPGLNWDALPSWDIPTEEQ